MNLSTETNSSIASIVDKIKLFVLIKWFFAKKVQAPKQNKLYSKKGERSK